MAVISGQERAAVFSECHLWPHSNSLLRRVWSPTLDTISWRTIERLFFTFTSSCVRYVTRGHASVHIDPRVLDYQWEGLTVRGHTDWSRGEALAIVPAVSTSSPV
ncbi:hypothetical protein RRG08_001133 [Elysia crispata]|uniref:Uncharacterized protein n=1 Tax=Elysia crispata TaxID=231223 RepID=A0AAE0Y265_9GAST|nr:hypothetical protein RRG08_001133 [Elysia crispata]